MDIAAIKAELLGGHPVTGAYNSDDVIATAELNALNVDKNLTFLSGSAVFNAIDKGEFNALVAADKQLVWDILHLGTIDPFGLEATLFTDIFGGGGSNTIISLGVIRKTSISRAVELGLGVIKVGWVEKARE